MLDPFEHGSRCSRCEPANGSGPALYVGGAFTIAGGLPAARIARWNASGWSAVGAGLGFDVAALVAFDDGNGPALYAAGTTIDLAMINHGHVAKWNGTAWTPLGPDWIGTASALAVFDAGNGPRLHVGGSSLDGQVQVWDGSSWSALPEGPNLNGFVWALASFDDGGGARLYAGGTFQVLTDAGFTPAKRIARWDGASWSPVGAGFDHNVMTLCSFDDGTGAALYAGGVFTLAYDSGDSYLAKWGCVTGGAGTPFCFGDGSAGAATCPCANAGAIGHGCANSQAASGGARLVDSGDPAGDTVVMHASAMLPSAACIFLQGDADLGGGVPFGDGLRCAGGVLKRLAVKIASGGAAQYPQAGEASIRARSASLGDPIPAGAARFYQTYYRDPSSTFCPPPAGSTWNVTNGVRIDWP